MEVVDGPLGALRVGLTPRRVVRLPWARAGGAVEARWRGERLGSLLARPAASDGDGRPRATGARNRCPSVARSK